MSDEKASNWIEITIQERAYVGDEVKFGSTEDDGLSVGGVDDDDEALLDTRTTKELKYAFLVYSHQ